MINIDKNLFLQHQKNIIAITSGVGSMGKTWLATTLAQALNMHKRSVLLVDGGGGLANLDYQLNLSAKQTINEVISGLITLNQALIPINKRKFDVLTASSGSDLLESLSVGQLQILREDLLTVAQNYQYTIIDLPSSEKIIKQLMPPQINLLVVCTDDPSNLVATYNFLQSDNINNNYANLQIVVNYASSYEGGLRTYNTLRQACEQFVRQTPPLCGVIRRDTRVRDAIRNHVLLLNRYPNAEAAEDVMKIAAQFIEQEKENGFSF